MINSTKATSRSLEIAKTFIEDLIERFKKDNLGFSISSASSECNGNQEWAESYRASALSTLGFIRDFLAESKHWTKCTAVEYLEHEPTAQELEQIKRKVAAELADAIMCSAFIMKCTPNWAPCPKEWSVASVIQVRGLKKASAPRKCVEKVARMRGQ